MKVCFVGTGSIGKRHIRNLKTICIEKKIDLEIHVLRFTTTPIDQEISGIVDKEWHSLSDIVEHYDIIFITNPTNMHYETLLNLREKANSFFIEKPLFQTKDKDIEVLNLQNEKVYYIACPLRYSGVIQEAERLITDWKIYGARAISSSYLPDWRPSIDYTKTYCAHSSQGGGVRLDIIHEWDYLIHLFGKPNIVNKMYGKFSNLKINSEDLAIYIAQYKDKLIELHLDYFGRQGQRYLEIFADNGTWKFDILNSEIYKNGNFIKKIEENANEKYLREIRHFLDIHMGRKVNNNDIFMAMDVMSIAE